VFDGGANFVGMRFQVKGFASPIFIVFLPMFEALEILRGHLSRCLGQIAAIAGMEAPTEGLI
jgi:hypothetical protein